MWRTLNISSTLVACILLKSAFAAPAASDNQGTIQNIPTVSLKIKIPDSTEVVNTDVAADSLIPDCVRKDPSTVEEKTSLTVSAEIFTECARKELRRVQDELDKPEVGSGTRGNKAEKSADHMITSPHDHERVNQGILAQHGVQNKENSAKEKGATDIVGNATTDAVKAAANSSDMLSVLQTVFDYKRVMNDLRRVLRGDVFGVLGEYPGRMNGLFKMVQELPRRIMKSIGIVNRLRTDTTDSTFKGVLGNLKEYLTHASQNAKNLPDAINMIGVMEALRNVASKIGDGVHRRVDDIPSQIALRSRLEAILNGAIAQRDSTLEQGRGVLSRAIAIPERIIPDGLHFRQFFHFGNFGPRPVTE